jgi:galacturan 1,4-alpha-galacturonidase
VCSDISAISINVMSPNGSKLAYCQNVNPAMLDVTCTSVLKGFN